MRSVKIEHIEYEQFERIYDAIVQYQHYAIVSAPAYRPNLKTAVFYFWDESYIPCNLMEFVTKPPNAGVATAFVEDAIDGVIEEIKEAKQNGDG